MRRVVNAPAHGNQLTHGHSAGPENRASRTYVSWQHMKQRCLNQNNHAWHLYGGRGIAVDERWLNDFSAFLADMGERPPGMSLDRIDSDGNYEPGNVRWADAKTQRRNSRRPPGYRGGRRVQRCIVCKRVEDGEPHYHLSVGESRR